MKLVAMEKERAGNDLDNIQATTFQIRAERGEYVFYVVDQTYR